MKRLCIHAAEPLNALPGNVAARYQELAVFPEDVRIPETTILKFWNHTGGLKDYQARALLRDLQTKGMLFVNEEKKETRVGFHDMQQDFLHLIAENLPALHDSSFLNAMDPSPASRANSERWARLPAGEPYLWHLLVYHLLEAGRGEELRALLTGARWLIAATSRIM